MLVCSHFLIFVRGEVHCGRFGRGDSVKEVCRQVVIVTMVGIVVTEGTLRTFFICFLRISLTDFKESVSYIILTDYHY